MRRHFAIAACVLTSLALSSPARVHGFGASVILGPTQDFKAAEDHPDRDITISSAGSFHVPLVGDFVYTDSLIIHLRRNVNMLTIGYVESDSSGFAGTATVTTIYGIDQNPSGPALEMTGVDPTNPQFSPTSSETLFGNSGTPYVSSFAFTVPIAGLSEILGPGYDLSAFAGGDPNSLVYGFQTTVSGADFLTSSVPEPGTLVCCAQAMAMLGGLFIWRRRRGCGNRLS